MAGIELKNLLMSDMVDVLHYLFEEENTYTSEEQMKSKLKVRERVYETLYDQEFKYKYVETKTNTTSYGVDTPANPSQNLDNLPYQEEGIKPFRPKEQQKEPPKPYIPPTTFNPDNAKPFGSILDAPLG